MRHRAHEQIATEAIEHALDLLRSVDGIGVVRAVPLGVHVRALVASRHDPQAKLAHRPRDVGERLVGLCDLETHRFAGAHARRDLGVHEDFRGRVRVVRWHDREKPSLRSQEDALRAIGVTDGRLHTRDARVERPAAVVFLADDVDRFVDDRIGRRVVHEDDVVGRVHETRTADEHPVGLLNGIDVGARHEVVPLRDRGEERPELRADGVLADLGGVDEEDHQRIARLNRARGADHRHRIARRCVDAALTARVLDVRSGVGRLDRSVVEARIERAGARRGRVDRREAARIRSRRRITPLLLDDLLGRIVLLQEVHGNRGVSFDIADLEPARQKEVPGAHHEVDDERDREHHAERDLPAPRIPELLRTASLLAATELASRRRVRRGGRGLGGTATECRRRRLWRVRRVRRVRPFSHASAPLQTQGHALAPDKKDKRAETRGAVLVSFDLRRGTLLSWSHA